jgi:hypothetical protein
MTMRSAAALSLVVAVVAAVVAGAGGASGHEKGAEPHPARSAKPAWLRACVALWNGDHQVLGVSAQAWHARARKILVTRDRKGGCVVAFDSAACSSTPPGTAWAWVHKSAWREYVGFRPSEQFFDILSHAHVWLDQLRHHPNARVDRRSGHVSLI